MSGRYPTPPSTAVSVEIEVPFHDVDALNVVWHGHYCKYLEIARTALLRARRLDAADLIAFGYRFMVAETRLRHLLALRYGDRVRVTAWPVEIENRITIQYDLTDVASGRRCAQGTTVLVTTTGEGELCMWTPRPILDRMAGALPATGGSP
ncbi:MAG TPA: thioesterase family protein [Anaeromyxobacteraceae bacterium]|nr:thioesterase family protein [Anaeromyxobacteraceae bacterium]